jgi:hypothetical protein
MSLQLPGCLQAPGTNSSHDEQGRWEAATQGPYCGGSSTPSSPVSMQTPQLSADAADFHPLTYTQVRRACMAIPPHASPEAAVHAEILTVHDP